MFRDAPLVDVQRGDDEFDRHRAYDGRIAPNARVGAVEFFHRQAGYSHVLGGVQPQTPYPRMDHRDVGTDYEIGLVAGEPRVEEPLVGRVGDKGGNSSLGFERMRFAEEGAQELFLHALVEPVRQDKAQPRIAPVQAGLHGQFAGMKVILRHVRETRRFKAHAYGDAAETFPIQVDLSQPRGETPQNDSGYPSG